MGIWQTIVSGVHRLSTARPEYLLAALALYVVSLFIVGARWRGFLRALGGRTSVVRATLATLAGIATNNVTPSSRVGGEACRIALVRMAGDATWRQATTAAVWDRLSEAPSLVVLVVMSALAVRGLAVGWRTAAIVAGIAGGASVIVLVARRFWEPVASGAWRQLLSLDRVTGRVFGQGVGYSVLLWVQDVLRLMCVAWAFGIALAPTQAALLSILTVVGGLVPTLGGLGAVEGGLVAGLVALGIDVPTSGAITAAERVISYGLSTAAGLIVIALQGGRSLWAAARGRVAPAEAATAASPDRRDAGPTPAAQTEPLRSPKPAGASQSTDILAAGYAYSEATLGKATGYYPFFRVISSSDGPVVTANGKRVVMLGSNNYLGLTHHPEVLKAAHDALDRYGVGCTGSRFLNGNLDLHEQLESELAEFTGKQEALVFSSGVLANIGTLGLIGAQEGAVLFLASENHASLFDGARLSHGRIALFKDVQDLERKLSYREAWPNALVVTDGVFSMTGRVADLRKVVELKRRFGFRLYLDDAHGFGVLGPQGRGTAASQGVERDVDLLFATFSKSLASIGSFVAGDRPVIEYLRHNVRTLIFSAALPPASVAGALAALRVMRRDADLFKRLWDNVAFFKQGVERLGFHTLDTKTPIIPLFIGSEALAFAVCRDAFELGLFTTPAVYPAVPKGHALIRTSVTPAHTREHLEQALQMLKTIAKRWPIPQEDPATIPVARETDLAEWSSKYLADSETTEREVRRKP